MVTSESVAKLLPALAKAQAEIPRIERKASNPHFRSSYATLDDILSIVEPILHTHGLLVTGGTPPGTEGDAREVGVQTRLWHISGEYIETTVWLPVSKYDAQGVGSAITYGRRYGICTLLGLATGEDDDGNQAAKAAPKPARAKPQTISTDEVVRTIAASKTLEELEERCGTEKFRGWVKKLEGDEQSRVRAAYVARKAALSEEFAYGPPPMEE